MTDSDRHDDERDRRPDSGGHFADGRRRRVQRERPPEPGTRPSSGRVDRRTFIAGGLRVGGAITAASLGVEALADPDSAPAHRRREPGPYRRTSQPNILVIMVDQLRTPRWFGPGTQGLGLPPNIAALARSGVSFARHYTASNDCTPARATMLTGLHTHQTGCMITGVSTLDPGFPTWGTMLREQGYATNWYGKWHLTTAIATGTSERPAGARALRLRGRHLPLAERRSRPGLARRPQDRQAVRDWYEAAARRRSVVHHGLVRQPPRHRLVVALEQRDASEATAPSTIASLPPNYETPEQLAARRKPALQHSLQLTSAQSPSARSRSAVPASRRPGCRSSTST
jgi:hypothetical protein